MKTFFYNGRVKSHNNTLAVLKTTVYHGKKCVDNEGFTYRITTEEEAVKCWKIFDFETEVGKVISEDEAIELASAGVL